MYFVLDSFIISAFIMDNLNNSLFIFFAFRKGLQSLIEDVYVCVKLSIYLIYL